MRIESKEVTVVKNIYISDDGKEFHDEDACLNHEFNIRKKMVSEYCYDVHCNKSTIDECVIVYLPDDEAVKAFVSVFDTCGLVYYGIDKPGLYIWTECGDNWVNVDEVKARIKGGQTNED